MRLRGCRPWRGGTREGDEPLPHRARKNVFGGLLANSPTVNANLCIELKRIILYFLRVIWKNCGCKVKKCISWT